MSKMLWKKVLGEIDTGRVKLPDLERTGKPNDALIGPKDMDPDVLAPTYLRNPWELFAVLIERISEQDVEWLEKDTSGLYARVATYSPAMKFPDINHIWVLPIDDDTSTLALYASARLGHSDMGKNRKRLDGWLKLLDDLKTE